MFNLTFTNQVNPVIRRLLLVFILFNCIHPLLWGQDFRQYRHYTSEDGLPSSYLYRVIQDCDGYIWVATDAGVACFNGQQFKSYTTVQGLPDNDVLNMYLDANCRLWFIHFNGRLSFFEGGKVKLFEREGLPDNILARGIFMSAEGEYWISCFNTGIYRVTADAVYHYSGSDSLNGSRYTFGGLDQKGDLLFGTIGGIGRFDGKGFRYYAIDTNYNNVLMRYGAELLRNGKVLIVNPSVVLIAYDTSHFVKVFPPGNFQKDITIQTAKEDSAGNLIISTNMGLYSVSHDSSGGEINHVYLPGEKINSTWMDDEGNLWAASPINGLFMLSKNARNTSSYTSDNLLIDNSVTSILPLDSDRVILGGSHGLLQDLNLEQQTTTYFRDLGTANNITSLERLGEDSLYYGSTLGITMISLRNIASATTKLLKAPNLGVENGGSTPWYYRYPKQYNQLCFTTVKDIITLESGMVGMAVSGGIHFMEKQQDANTIVKVNMDNSRATCILDAGDSIVWGGTLNGIVVIDLHNKVEVAETIMEGLQVSKMEKDDKGVKWVGTVGSGLWMIDEDSMRNFTMKDGLKNNSITYLYYFANALWAGTKNGLHRITVSDDGKVDIWAITVYDGLVSNEVNTIAGYGNKLYVGTNKGLSVLYIDSIAPVNLPPKPMITGVRINYSDTAILSTYQLNYEQNNIELDFVGLSYKSGDEVQYGYMLAGLDTSWQYTTFTSVRYPKLSPGKYVFKLKAQSVDGIWSLTPASIYFNITPPFWGMLWFRILVIVVILLMAIGIFAWRIKVIRSKEAEKTAMNKRIAESRLKTLQAQMNPHFMSNALNSIQHFVLNNDSKLAGLYLMKFSRLMRLVLEASSRDVISLAEELEALKLYLELETLRFEGRISFVIKVGDNIEAEDIDIPAMLIQPFVENAIVHGLSSTLQGGELEVRFRRKNGTLHCTIIDNGVGLKQGKEVASNGHGGKKHTSRAIGIIQERMEIIQQNNGSKVHIEIGDRSELQPESTGTEVTIDITL